MYLRKHKKRNNYSYLIWGTVALIFILFVYTFWTEINSIGSSLMAVLRIFWAHQLPGEGDKSLHYLAVLIFNCCCSFIPALLIIIFITASQALLPASTLLERYRTGFHLILHTFHLHGPAIFIKDGKTQSTEEDFKRKGPGVIVIDFNSAVVLEERIPTGGFKRTIIKLFESLMTALNLYEPFNSPRAHGAGIAFLRINERIRGVVDLRKQNRSRADIKAYTRDGIEISTLIWSIFSVAQEPPVLQVTYLGRPAPENLRVLNIKRNGENAPVQIVSFDDELDEADRKEIHETAQSVLRGTSLTPYQDLPRPPQMVDYQDFKREDSLLRQRVFAAVFTQARDNQEELIPWENLPPQVAVDIFRELLSHYNYDQLFQPLAEGGSPVADLKNKFRIQVRNTGMLSYRLVFHKSRRSLSKGEYNPNSLVTSQVYNLNNPKVLRERGISIIASGFPFLKPPDLVYEQHLDSWRARWEKEYAIARSSGELEAARVRSRARAQAQEELRYNLLNILRSSQYPQETLALRVLQSLESAAADPKTRQLLPADTIKILEALRTVIVSPPSAKKDRFE